jgi:hypothetical protein
MAETITRKTKGKAKEKPKDTQPARTKEGRELVPFVVGSYFTHNLFNIVYMQIMKSNNNRRSRTNISCQRNLPFYNKG